MAALAQPVPLDIRCHEVMERTPLPDGVTFLSAEERADHSGDAALYLVFSISKRLKMTKRKMDQLRDFRLKLTMGLSAVLDGIIPYILFREGQ